MSDSDLPMNRGAKHADSPQKRYCVACKQHFLGSTGDPECPRCGMLASEAVG